MSDSKQKLGRAEIAAEAGAPADGGTERFGIVVRFELKDEAAAQRFDALVAQTAVGVRDLEPGTLVYAVHPVEDSPLSRVFYELYASREAHREHEATEHTRHFLAERGQYLAGRRVEFLGSPTGKGI